MLDVSVNATESYLAKVFFKTQRKLERREQMLEVELCVLFSSAFQFEAVSIIFRKIIYNTVNSIDQFSFMKVNQQPHLQIHSLR